MPRKKKRPVRRIHPAACTVPDKPDYFYSIIYSFDCKSMQSVEEDNPPRKQRRKKLWKQTEGDDQYEQSYDCNCESDERCTCGHRHGKHRKWCAILNQEQFDEFVEHCGLTASSTPTMGAVGAPGFGVSCAPAIAFYGPETACSNAYVTPCPKEGDDFWATNELWEQVIKQVIEHYE